MLRDLLWSEPSPSSRVIPKLNTRRSRLIVALFAIVIAIAVATGGWRVIASGIPPRTITLATGPEGSAYAQIGQRYRAIFARSGVDLRLQATAGSVENLAKLRDSRSGVSAGFAIAGLAGAKEASEVESLGTLFYDPLWLFERTLGKGFAFEGLAGKQVSLGSEGSGTRALANDLLVLAGTDTRRATLLDLPPAEAADRLFRREVDIVALVDSWDSPLIRRLVASPEISLVTFRRADALVALRPHLNKLILPTGVGDLATNRPPSDVVLIAPKASLLVRRDLHEAVQFLLLDAAAQIHSGPGIFHRAGTFPAAESIDHPLSREAVRFHKAGRPFLQRYLPFWLAVLAERLLLLLVPRRYRSAAVPRGPGGVPRNSGAAHHRALRRAEDARNGPGGARPRALSRRAAPSRRRLGGTRRPAARTSAFLADVLHAEGPHPPGTRPARQPPVNRSRRLPVVAEPDRGQDVAPGHIDVAGHSGSSKDEL